MIQTVLHVFHRIPFMNNRESIIKIRWEPKKIWTLKPTVQEQDQFSPAGNKKPVAAVNSYTRRGWTKIVGVEEPCGAGQGTLSRKIRTGPATSSGNQGPGGNRWKSSTRKRTLRAGPTASGGTGRRPRSRPSETEGSAEPGRWKPTREPSRRRALGGEPQVANLTRNTESRLAAVGAPIGASESFPGWQSRTTEKRRNGNETEQNKIKTDLAGARNWKRSGKIDARAGNTRTQTGAYPCARGKYERRALPARTNHRAPNQNSHMNLRAGKRYGRWQLGCETENQRRTTNRRSRERETGDGRQRSSGGCSEHEEQGSDILKIQREKARAHARCKNWFFIVIQIGLELIHADVTSRISFDYWNENLVHNLLSLFSEYKMKMEKW
jgi:hypothetical protein